MIQPIIFRRSTSNVHCAAKANYCRHLTSRHASSSSSRKSVSFFDRVNDQMKRDSPYKYEQYLKGRQQAMEKLKWKLEDQRVSSAGKWYNRKNDRLSSCGEVSAEANEGSTRTKSLFSSVDSVLSTSERSSHFDQSASEQPTKPSIFSTITADIQALETKSQDGKSSASLFLQDLFQEANKRNQPVASNKNTAMMYHPDHWETYQTIMTSVMEDEKTERVLKKLFKSAKDKRMLELVKEWLLSDERVVEKEVVGERWRGLDEIWRAGWASGAATIFDRSDDVKAAAATLTHATIEDNEDEAEGAVLPTNDGGASAQYESKLLAELKLQQDLFIVTLLTQHPDILKAFLPDSDENNEQSQAELELLAKSEITKTFHKVATRIIAFLGRYCAKRSRSDPMHVAWYKIKESGLQLSPDVISTLLYIVTTMGGGTTLGFGASFGSQEEEEDSFAVPGEVATYHDLLCKPTESSVSLRVKTLASRGDTKTAEELLEAFKKSLEDTNSDELLRLRTYIPVFKNYCDSKNIPAALSVFKRMQSTAGVILEPENYCMLLSSMVEAGCFCNDSSPIDGAQNLGYTHSCGPKLFDEIATEMAEDVLEITSSSARKLSNAFAVGFKNASGVESTSLDDVVSNIKKAHPLAPMPVTKQPAAVNEMVACRVLLDRSTGVCEVTGSQQRLILLEPDQRKQLHDDLIDLSHTQFINYTQGMASHDKHAANDPKDKATEQMQIFSNWLNTREGEPFTAIVDGANVGYYMQSFDKGRFNYHQIKFVVDTLEARGENPLVVIPNKYGHSNYIYTSNKEYQELTEAEVDIMKDLSRRDKIYKVPPRCLDDFYWMVASVSDQTASRKGADLSVPSNDPDGRFPGTRPMLITNDQMRDHRLELLEPRLFRRWYGCHIVNYNFTAFVMDESVKGNEIRFAQADFFSREIQCNECPTTCVAENGKWEGIAWHFPVSDWDLDERFVIRIPYIKH